LMKKSHTIGGLIGLAVVMLVPTAAFCLPQIDLSIGNTDEPDQVVTGLKLIGLLTVLAIAPAILMTMTCFTRIIIVFSFLKQAIGTQQVPPAQVLIGLALFLTVFVMAPVGIRINEEAIVPYQAGDIGDEEAFELAKGPIREFMLAHTREKDLMLFYEIADIPLPNVAEEVEFFFEASALICSGDI